MVGKAGLEPANAGAKTRCLTGLATSHHIGLLGEIRTPGIHVRSMALFQLSFEEKINNKFVLAEDARFELAWATLPHPGSSRRR